MFKKVLLAGALLAPVLAYGSSPSTDLSVQIVPAASPTPPPTPPPTTTNLTPPAPAQAAGFTTLVANYDFTGQTSDGVHPANWYETITNWLTCVGGYTAAAPVFQTVRGPGNKNFPPCSDFNMINDNGKTVFYQSYSVADWNTGQHWKAEEIQGCDDLAANCVGANIPVSTMYYEIMDRVTQATVNAYSSSKMTILSDDWSWPIGNNGNEYDFIETYNQYGTTTAGPDGHIYGMAWGNVPATTYTTYGMLITSNGTNDQNVCEFENNILVQCTDQKNAGSFGQRSYLILTVGAQGGPVPANTMEHLVQRVRVWSCATAATRACYGSKQYNSGGLLYWHN